MEKQLKIGTTTLTVEEVYPYRYDFGKGKEVLRISISKENHSFEELEILNNCTLDISYLEGGELILNYSNYSLDYNCQYNNGIFSIEITRLSEETQRLNLMETAFNELILE